MPEETSKEQEADIVHAFYVVYNRKEDKFGVVGSPGFFENKIRALGALSDITQQIHEYYAKQRRLDQKIIVGAKNMMSHINFRNFRNRVK